MDDIIPIKEPQFIQRCFKILIERNIQTRQDIELNLPYSLRDIEILSNLPEGILQNNSNDSLSVNPKIKRGTEEGVQIFHIKN